MTPGVHFMPTGAVQDLHTSKWHQQLASDTGDMIVMGGQSWGELKVAGSLQCFKTPCQAHQSVQQGLGLLRGPSTMSRISAQVIFFKF